MLMLVYLLKTIFEWKRRRTERRAEMQTAVARMNARMNADRDDAEEKGGDHAL
jgi:hypothetical protein